MWNWRLSWSCELYDEMDLRGFKLLGNTNACGKKDVMDEILSGFIPLSLVRFAHSSCIRHYSCFCSVQKRRVVHITFWSDFLTYALIGNLILKYHGAMYNINLRYFMRNLKIERHSFILWYLKQNLSFLSNSKYSFRIKQNNS